MDDESSQLAAACLKAAYDGTMDFPSIVGALIAGGFESYAIDFRGGEAAYYLSDGDWVALPLPEGRSDVAATFDIAQIREAIGEAQRGAAGYTYEGFCNKIKAAGCAAYIVSFSGRRALYVGRTAEIHVEYFPS